MTTFGMNSPFLSSRRDAVLVPTRSMAKSEVRFEHEKFCSKLKPLSGLNLTWCQKKGDVPSQIRWWRNAPDSPKCRRSLRRVSHVVNQAGHQPHRDEQWNKRSLFLWVGGTKFYLLNYKVVVECICLYVYIYIYFHMHILLCGFKDG